MSLMLPPQTGDVLCNIQLLTRTKQAMAALVDIWPAPSLRCWLEPAMQAKLHSAAAVVVEVAS
jgi:hypothetical protein